MLSLGHTEEEYSRLIIKRTSVSTITGVLEYIAMVVVSRGVSTLGNYYYYAGILFVVGLAIFYGAMKNWHY